MSTFPREVLDDARSLAEILCAHKERPKKYDAEIKKKLHILRIINKLRSVLPILQKVEIEAAKNYLLNLRKQFYDNVNTND